ncbi:conserved hypothetical protein [Ricinus communis]|uniref:DUF4283 domain-containing protein n=1 Tax=Ricinus communis TaxID=3988 RepID=B9SBB2_RICCO|nr:conserved hypothetical protein [Ricinus communis]
MASPSGTPTSIEDFYARLNIEEEEYEDITFEDVAGHNNKLEFKWCLVSHLLTDRAINFQTMKNTLVTLWRPAKGVCIKDLRPNFYVFQFLYELDIVRVTDGGP